MDNSQDKLVDLEMKIAFLERTTDDLGDVLLAQSSHIEKLEARLRELEDRMASKQEGEPQESADPLEERPPHY